MYKRLVKKGKTSIKVNESYIGESIEVKVRRVVNQNEPITDGAPRIYTERKDGVKPEYDIRTDRFELAVDATDYMTKTSLAERAARLAEMNKGLNEANEA